MLSYYIGRNFSHISLFGALLTDLSKAFDCIDHNLLISKLHSYGVSMPELQLLCSYLSNRTQRVKINDEYSEKR